MFVGPSASLWGHGQSSNHATWLLPLLPFTTPKGSCLITMNVYLSRDKLLAQSTNVIVFLVRTGWKDGVVLAHIFFCCLFFQYLKIAKLIFSWTQIHFSFYAEKTKQFSEDNKIIYQEEKLLLLLRIYDRIVIQGIMLLFLRAAVACLYLPQTVSRNRKLFLLSQVKQL